MVNLGFGFLVYLKTGARTRVNLSFSVLAWAGAGWALSFFMVYVFKDDSSRLFWGRMGFAASGIIPAAFLTFSLVFPREQHRFGLTRLVCLGIPTLVFFSLSFTDRIVSSVGSGSKMFSYGPFYLPFSIYLTGYILVGLLFLVATYKQSMGMERLQVKYCLIGMIFTSSLALIVNLFLPMAGISRFNWLGPTFTMIMLAFTAYSIVRHRLMDINLVLKKGTNYILLTIVLLLPSALLILLSQKFFFREINYYFSIFIFSVFLLVMIFFQKIKPRTEKVVEHLLFKDRYNYRETLGRFSKALVTILDLQSLSENIIQTTTETMGVAKGSFLIMDEEKGGYSLIASRNLNSTGSPLLAKGDPLPHYLQTLGEILVREELIKGNTVPELNQVADQMLRLEAEISIPLIWKRELVGIINLSHKFNRDTYSHEDHELLTTLANQAAIAIENARLYEDLKKSKSYIRRADRLASLGTLTAGLAHEIRNPLVAIKTFTQLLPERLEDEEFRNHFMNIASGEVDRISSLVTELLEFARPSEPKLEIEDINAILDGMILLISTETKSKHIEIVKDYATDLRPVTLDREHMKQVFLNILLNAIEATPENGKVFVKTRSFVRPDGERFVQVEFTDTGCGIPQEHLEDIFTPFFTTKNKGSGLGLSISNQIVQDHRGYIAVESRVRNGTSFFVNLPVDQDIPKRRKSDLKSNQRVTNPLEHR